MLYANLQRNITQKYFSVHVFIPELTSKLPIHLDLSCYFIAEVKDESA